MVRKTREDYTNMKDTDEITIARSNDFKKTLHHYVDKNCGQKTCAREIFRGTGLFQTHFKNNDNTIISRSSNFGKALLFFSGNGMLTTFLL